MGLSDEDAKSVIRLLITALNYESKDTHDSELDRDEEPSAKMGVRRWKTFLAKFSQSEGGR